MTSISRTRAWLLFGLLCAAGIFNAMDRPIIAILKPDMSAEFGWTDEDFGRLAAITQFSAALSFLFTGWMIDRLGVRRSMLVGVTAWSIAAAAHGWARTGWHVVAARIGLGATEAVQTPLTIKTVATLFSPRLRGLAIGAGTLVGAIGTIGLPFAIPLIAANWGWRGALLFAGGGGFVILALWWIAARGVVLDDRAEDPALDFDDDGRPYGPILTERRTWAIVVAKALSDSTWWLLSFWLPDFYRRALSLSTEQLALPLAIAFLGSGVGSFIAGWISERLVARGWPARRVRFAVMLASALIVAPVPLVLGLESYWATTIMMALVLAGHQGFSLSIFAIITDVVPRSKVGRVTAFGAFCGNMGGVGIVWVTGLVLASGASYVPLFVFAGASYLLAYGWIRLVMPGGRHG